MSQIPILQVGPVLLVSIQVELNDRVASELQKSILMRIKETDAVGTLIDITALDLVDSFIGRVLNETARMASIMNIKVVLVGMRPTVAMTFLEMGLELDGIETESDVETGLRALGYQLTEIHTRNSEAPPPDSRSLPSVPDHGYV